MTAGDNLAWADTDEQAVLLICSVKAGHEGGSKSKCEAMVQTASAVSPRSIAKYFTASIGRFDPRVWAESKE